MDSIETTSTSAQTASAKPIVLRQSEQVRLVFVPTLVENLANPRAAINGEFIYQRKGKHDNWEAIPITSLGTVKKGESYKLDLHSAELLALVDALGPLYRLVWKTGVPQGKKEFVKVEHGVERFLKLNEADFRAFLDAHADNAATTLNRLLQWLTSSPKLPEIAATLAALPPAELPSASAVLGLSSLKAACAYWDQHSANSDEEFWQTSLADRAFVLSQLFSYPVVLLKDKAYVGGKSFSNSGGSSPDFLLQAAATDALLIVEIKTPSTALLSKEYRTGVYPPSSDLAGAVAQGLHYRQNLVKNFYSLKVESGITATLGEPRIVVLAGNSKNELDTPAKRESFELLRDRLRGVTVVTFDELFGRLAASIALLESLPLDE